MSMGYDYLMVTRPERFMEELRKQLEAWDRKGAIGVSELRQAAGRVAWLAGVLPRARWVTSTLYAVLYSHEADQSSGAEAERRAKRQDQLPRVSNSSFCSEWLECTCCEL